MWGVTDLGYTYMEQGMILREVREMLGKYGEKVASNGFVRVHQWEAKDLRGNYGIISGTFVNGRLDTKGRSGVLPAM